MPVLYAYIDPFTGTLVLQFLAAIFFGIIAFFKPIINRVKTILGIGKNRQADDLELQEAETFKFNETNKETKKAA